jgi:hypothetical protein
VLHTLFHQLISCPLSPTNEFHKGSYGSFLAAAFRMNYPKTFDVTLASAGPVMGFGGSSDPESWNWWNWVSHHQHQAH